MGFGVREFGLNLAQVTLWLCMGRKYNFSKSQGPSRQMWKNSPYIMHYGECRTLCLTDVQPFLPSAFLSIIRSFNKQLLNIYDVCLPFLALAYSDTQDRPPDFMNFTKVFITILRINEKH